MRRLRGSLNVATLEDIFEEENHVHIVMELCQGGELIHRIGSKHYSERTVSCHNPSSALIISCLLKQDIAFCKNKEYKRCMCVSCLSVPP